MMKEFKEFAMKGSLIDLAIGFVMGAAFTKVTGAFINGMVMPLVGMIQGKDLSDWKFVLKDADKVAGTEEVAIKYGSFISVTIEFIIVAFVMFMVIKAINRMKKKQEEAPAAPAEPSSTDKLLIEIRDALKK
ncbi:MAG TPA: large-conductance mechanosensitive channel protein MscL [Chitinophagaceae bacterium]|nr:large-conductance mechanosensitive channel protein MscL [Chitinophagaceae bacterium]HNF28725.1 large-conductance mechanosensitive channel protein MscL [Chitinophagaceae bacterium]HNJ57787.1 large-conductance mechanosensitive channel protein MscL [Chitinophagaceae bacterium]HNM33279.1 large-conductance mechanosensitive channel protein MscL [Chitinophagaceae bacterium]HNN30253.1 large-conductance mechanosensitive channel protein MscL [Chitinophagaceae bacterium]